jgi:hypothetical protein
MKVPYFTDNSKYENKSESRLILRDNQVKQETSIIFTGNSISYDTINNKLVENTQIKPPLPSNMLQR